MEFHIRIIQLDNNISDYQKNINHLFYRYSKRQLSDSKKVKASFFK